MKPSLSLKIINASFAAIILTVVLVFSVSVHQSRRVKNTSEEVNRTHQVIRQIQLVIFTGLDIQSSVRGYTVTGQQKYLGEIDTAVKGLPSHVGSLRILVTGDRQLQGLLDSLQVYLAKRMEVTSRLITLRSNGKLQEAFDLIGSGKGQEYMEKIKAIGAWMEKIEKARLDQRIQVNDRSILNFDIILYAVLLVVFTLAALLFYRVRLGIALHRVNEEKFRSLLDAAPDAMFIAGREGYIKMQNDQSLRMFGYTAPELAGMPVELLIPGNIITGYINQYGGMAHSVSALQKHDEFELEACRKDGSRFPVEVRISPIRTKDGMMVSASVRDITRRRRSQQQLSSLKLQIDQSNDAIFTVGKDMLIESWNYGAEKLFGFTKEEAIGRRSVELLRMDIDPEEQAAIQRKVEQENYWTGEVKRYAKNDEAINVISSITAIRDNRGELAGYVSVNYDMRTVNELRNQVQHLANIVEHSSEAILSRGADMRIRSWNEGARQLFGYTREEAIGQTPAALGITKYSPAELEELETDIRVKGKWQAEKNYYHKNGSVFTGSATANLIGEGNNGHTGSVSFIIRDVTTRRQLEEHLLRSNEELEAKVLARTAQIYKTERRYRDTLENMIEGVQILDRDLRYIYVNEALAKQSNMTREALTGKLATELFPGVEHTALYGHIQECIRDQKVMQLESEFKFPDGRTSYFQLSFQPVPEGVFILSVDVTGKKTAEDGLRKSLQEKEMLADKLSSIINTLPANIALLDESGRVMDVNESWKKFAIENNYRDTHYGVGENYITVCRQTLIYGNKDGEEVAKGIRAVLDRQQETFEFEYECHNAAEQRWYRMLVSPFSNTYYNGVVVMHINITDLKKLEAERLKIKIEEQKNITKAILEGQERERSKIGRELHDNITQLMAAIKMKLGFFISKYHVQAPLLQQTMEHIQLALEETRSLSHQMVMPKFTQGVFQSEIRRLMEDYATGDRATHCSFTDFCETKTPVHIKETLYRILQEQLHNIDKYAGATTVIADVTTYRDHIVMVISDNGCGFDTAGVKQGIGLSNIQNRAESYSGHANIVSYPGRGCKLIVEIPFKG